VPAGAADCTPATLEGRWRVLTLGPDALPDRAEIGFAMEQRLFAQVGCNRLAGGYTPAHGVLRTGPMAATRMACPADLMARDDRLVDLLAAGAACRLSDAGLLHLGTLAAPDLTATR
jgi:heat shock protein HslJ